MSLGDRGFPGVYEARDNDLICLMIHDRDEDGTLTVSTLYQPSDLEIERLLMQYNLPVDYCMDIIRTRHPGAHTVLFELEKFLPHLRDKGYRI